MNTEEKCQFCKKATPREQVKAYIAVCGHIVCDECRNKMFGNGSTKGQIFCPTCKTLLRNELLFIRNYSDAGLTKELEIRKELQPIFVQVREDFQTQEDYNRYLEERDAIIYNLVNGIDIEATKQKIEKYKESHKDIIEKRKSKKETKSELEKRRQNYIKEEFDLLLTRKQNRDSILEALAFGKIGTETFIEQSKLMQQSWNNQNKEINEIKIENIKQNQTTKTKLSYVPQKGPVIPITNFSNVPQPLPILKPKSDVNPIQKEQQQRRAGGYNETLCQQRLVQEALTGLQLPNTINFSDS